MSGGGSFGNGGVTVEQSGLKMMVPPTFVHVAAHPSGTTAGGLAVAIRAANIAAAIAGSATGFAISLLRLRETLISHGC